MQASLSPRCLSHGGRERACGFGLCGLDLPAVPPSPGPGAVPFAGDSGFRAQSRAVRCPAPRVLAASVGTRVPRGGWATLLSPECTRGARWSHVPVGRLQEATGLGAPRPGPPRSVPFGCCVPRTERFRPFGDRCLGVWTDTAGQRPGQTRRLSSASRHSRSPVSACRTRRDISAEIAIVPRPLDGCAGPPLGTPCPAGGVADPAASSRGPRGAWTRI